MYYYIITLGHKYAGKRLLRQQKKQWGNVLCAAGSRHIRTAYKKILTTDYTDFKESSKIAWSPVVASELSVVVRRAPVVASSTSVVVRSMSVVASGRQSETMILR